MEKEDRYEPFQFADVHRVELKALLGPSQCVGAFLDEVERWINEAIWARGKGKSNYQYAPVTLRQMKDRLDKYERLCTAFLEGMSVIDEDLSKYNDRVREKDWPAILQIEAATLTEVDGTRRDFTDGFVSEVVGSVRTLEKLCKSAKDSLPPPKKGDLSPHEVMFQFFEDGIVEAYNNFFGRYPAKTDGAAFLEAMNAFYRFAGYPGGNSSQRVRKAVERCAEAADQKSIAD